MFSSNQVKLDNALIFHSILQRSFWVWIYTEFSYIEEIFNYYYHHQVCHELILILDGFIQICPELFLSSCYEYPTILCFPTQKTLLIFFSSIISNIYGNIDGTFCLSLKDFNIGKIIIY